jgi:hypothetical protein
MCLGVGRCQQGCRRGWQATLQFAIRRILRPNPEKSGAAEAAPRNSQWPQAGPKDLSESEQTDGRRS